MKTCLSTECIDVPHGRWAWLIYLPVFYHGVGNLSNSVLCATYPIVTFNTWRVLKHVAKRDKLSYIHHPLTLLNFMPLGMSSWLHNSARLRTDNTEIAIVNLFHIFFRSSFRFLFAACVQHVVVGCFQYWPEAWMCSKCGPGRRSRE